MFPHHPTAALRIAHDHEADLIRELHSARQPKAAKTTPALVWKGLTIVLAVATLAGAIVLFV